VNSVAQLHRAGSARRSDASPATSVRSRDRPAASMRSAMSSVGSPACKPPLWSTTVRCVASTYAWGPLNSTWAC